MNSIRNHFPLLSNNPNLVYLDNAATSQKPNIVIERIGEFYRTEYANVHRGIYKLSERASSSYEAVRLKSAQFLGGVDPRCVIFTSGTTDGINLVTQSWGRQNLRAGDEILLPVSEHHSNIIPWQLVAKDRGARLRFIPLTSDYRLDMEALNRLVSPKTRVITFAHVSNVLGIIHPVQELVEIAKQCNALCVVDGAQAAPHSLCDVKALDCDFYTVSAHKMCGPTGVGILYGRHDLLEQMPPYRGGGEMIATVEEQYSSWAELPHKFEAGTPNIAGVIGLGAAIDFLQEIDTKAEREYEIKLAKMVLDFLASRSEVEIHLGSTENWVGTVSFHHPQIHPHDMAEVLDAHDVCVRAGHHCAQPLMRHLKLPATTRISPYLYNNTSDVENLFKAIEAAERLFR